MQSRWRLESSVRIPFGPISPVRLLPYTPLYSLNSLNSLPLAWDITDRVRHPDRDSTPDAIPRCKVATVKAKSWEQQRQCRYNRLSRWREGPKGVAHQTLASHECPQMSSLFEGRKWDCVQRCRREDLKSPKGRKGFALITHLGMSLDSTDYALSVPSLSTSVLIVSGSEVGHSDDDSSESA